ncbi:hypothetical protein [Burkholderia multivorans]|uniref:hypothetical protein n=1 Tax=Burkholderia multivorans TaxID=87883 RepID=UPI0012FDF65E|nr:hypothetical protein [Burkholderia multivorans]
MSYISFGSGFLFGWCAAGMCIAISWAVRWWKKDGPTQAIDGWRDSFEESRARGHNTDAYTFEIAWAYARDYFERRAPASEGDRIPCPKGDCPFQVARVGETNTICPKNRCGMLIVAKESKS